MTWDTPRDDLRRFLSDGPTDKPRIRKKCFGVTDGTNVTFNTYEYRRLTNFSSSPALPLGVYVNGAIVAVSSDYPEFGEFHLTVAPTGLGGVEASYYVQWWIDAELDTFLQDASDWLSNGGVLTTITQAIRPCVLQYAASTAYQQLAMRYSQMDSERFRLEDSQNPKSNSAATTYLQMSEKFRAKAEELRKQFYTRQDQPEAPLFATAVGMVPNPVPRQ